MAVVRTRLREAIARARKFNQPVPDIDEAYLFNLFKNQKGKCALLGHDMVIERKHPLCPSLDKIEPGKGCLKSNVQWVT